MENGASSYRRFLDGDNEGIVEIIRDYKDGLMLYINEYVGNVHTSEDLMEETFLRLYVKKPKFSGKSSFKTFLYSVGRHIALDYIKKHSRVSVTSDELLSNNRDLEEIERQYIRDEQKIQLHRAMRKINPDYARVLYLMYFENFTLNQIASIIGKTYKQTDNLISRGRKALKSQLEKEDFIYENL